MLFSISTLSRHGIECCDTVCRSSLWGAVCAAQSGKSVTDEKSKAVSLYCLETMLNWQRSAAIVGNAWRETVTVKWELENKRSKIKAAAPMAKIPRQSGHCKPLRNAIM